VAIQIEIKPLGRPDVHQVSKFKMDDPSDHSLQQFIRRDAFKSGQANLTQTYVAQRVGEIRIVGSISLMCAEVQLELTYSITDKLGADRYETQPAVRIARLGIESSCQREGVGSRLVELAIGIAQTGIQPIVGCRFVILDAKQKSVTFYQRHGFRLLDTSENRNSHTPIMFLDLQNLV
jgi:GNAT superfamily N-acetyltransferase